MTARFDGPPPERCSLKYQLFPYDVNSVRRSILNYRIMYKKYYIIFVQIFKLKSLLLFTFLKSDSKRCKYYKSIPHTFLHLFHITVALRLAVIYHSIFRSFRLQQKVSQIQLTTLLYSNFEPAYDKCVAGSRQRMLTCSLSRKPLVHREFILECNLKSVKNLLSLYA